jgi:tetratricopeptide (TPR) repeat protein
MAAGSFTLISILALLCPLAGAQDSATEIHSFVVQARARSDYSEAIKLLRRLIDDDPKNKTYLYELTDVQRHAGLSDAALQTVDELLALDPANEPAVILKAEVLLGRDDWEAAIRALTVSASFSDSYEISHMLAESYLASGQLVEAAWFYEKVVRLKPEVLEDLVALGRLHLRRELPALAVRALKSALALAGDDPQVHYLLARAYQQAGRPLGRIRVLPLSQAIMGNTHGDWYVLEAVDDQPNHFHVCPSDSAIYHVQKAIELGVNEADVHLLSADIWFNANEYERARDSYETIEATLPASQSAGYHYRYGVTLYWLGDLEGFQRHVETAGNVDPKSYEPKRLEMHTLMADQYCIRGDLDRFIHHLEQAIEVAPRSVDLRYKLGNALFEAQQRAAALAQWQAVLQLHPNHPDRERLLKYLNDRDLEPEPKP